MVMVDVVLMAVMMVVVLVMMQMVMVVVVFVVMMYDPLQEVIFVRYAFAKGETRRHQCNC